MDRNVFEEWRSLVPADFADDSRVWVYQCSRMLRLQEALQVEEILQAFIAGWNSHGAPVKGYANLFFGQFIVIMADETATGVSGCSTDSSVRMLKELEQLHHVQWFDRLLLAFLLKNKVEMLPLHQLQYGMEKGFIGADTIYFNNLVATKKDWLEKWMIKVEHSWLASKLSFRHQHS